MNVAEYARAVLLQCPAIADTSPDMFINSLGENPLQFSIEPEPVNPYVKRYVGGDALRRFSFSLASTQYIISDADRTAVETLHEALTDWLLQQHRRLPIMGAGKQARSMLVIGGGYLYERAEDNNTAQYAIQIELQYYQTR